MKGKRHRAADKGWIERDTPWPDTPKSKKSKKRHARRALVEQRTDEWHREAFLEQQAQETEVREMLELTRHSCGIRIRKGVARAAELLRDEEVPEAIRNMALRAILRLANAPVYNGGSEARRALRKLMAEGKISGKRKGLVEDRLAKLGGTW